MIKVAIVGASGYSGAELVRILSHHQDTVLTHLFVSEQSADRRARIDSLYGQLCGVCSLELEPLSNEVAQSLTTEQCEVIFLATDHKVSHDLAPIFIKNGITVIDLSGAFRLSDLNTFEKYYGFAYGEEQKELLKQRVYALVDWVDHQSIVDAQLISMPGCYTTTSELALKPLTANGLLDTSVKAVINAVSGVSGAGRKAKLASTVCEVSLNAYGLFNHRHLPEIEEYAQCSVVFNPHLGDFKRGILATITARLKDNVTAQMVEDAFVNAYGLAGNELNENSALVRYKHSTVKLQDVQMQPFCDLTFTTDDEYIVISSALDNLLKGAASQAVEAMNIHFKLPRSRGLII